MLFWKLAEIKYVFILFILFQLIICSLYLYSAFLGTQSALHGSGLLSHHQCAASPGWCDGSHIAT